MDNNRNTILAVVLSLVVIVAWQFFYVSPKLEQERLAAEAQRRHQEQAAAQQAQPSDPQAGQEAGAQIQNPAQPGVAPGAGSAVDANLSREQAIATDRRIYFENPLISGSINLRGARIDDLRLKKYRETVKKDSPIITLLSPSTTRAGFFAELGWVSYSATGGAPGPETVWTAPDGAKLTPESPATLTWTNEAGVTFRRVISLDADYMFSIEDTIDNKSAAAASFSPYGRVTRFQKPSTPGNYLLHEGPIGVFGEEGLQYITYDDLEDEREQAGEKSDGGWIAINDKYWSAAITPGGAFKPRFAYFDDGRARWQADYLGDPVEIAAGASAQMRQLVFAGAKEVATVDRYEAQYGIKNFELLIDWGWFYFITKPLFYLLDWLFRMVGNFGVAILITTVIVKAIFFPLANMSYQSMAMMKKVQPEMTAIRERFADDKVKQQQEMMALYKREKINPAAGCWPVLLQIPVFFALYKVLFITIEMRHQPFFGWVQDLAAPDPTSLFNLFGLLPYDVPQFLLIGIWPLIMGVTMFLQMQMSPPPPDPTQQMIFKWMPVVFTFMLATFPAGLVIYWAWNNTLSILQQAYIMRRNGTKIELFDNLAALFRRKPKPAE